MYTCIVLADSEGDLYSSMSAITAVDASKVVGSVHVEPPEVSVFFHGQDVRRAFLDMRRATFTGELWKYLVQCTLVPVDPASALPRRLLLHSVVGVNGGPEFLRGSWSRYLQVLI